MGQDTIIQYVGCDVHKETITIAVATTGREPARVVATIPNRPEAVRRVMAQLGAPATLEVGYEAGPCGYTLQRQLTGLGITCVVIAPSLIPKRSGDRVKTDRRPGQDRPARRHPPGGAVARRLSDSGLGAG